MAIMLSILALVVASLACVAAWRAHRSSHRLALEMVQLRDRLAQAEAGRDAAERRAKLARPAESVDSHLRDRVEAVEARLGAAMERDRAPMADGAHDLRDEIRAHLSRQGYTRIAFLESGADGSVLVEAERHGTMTKGRAQVLSDGRVRLRSVSSVRAFP
jgi:hypothetical protein